MRPSINALLCVAQPFRLLLQGFNHFLVHETICNVNEIVLMQSCSNIASAGGGAYATPTHGDIVCTGVLTMKVSAFALATVLGWASISTSSAFDQCAGQEYLKTGTVFEIAQQYANGGKFGGVSSGATGNVLDVARGSVDFFSAPDLFASVWRAPVVAKGK
ncbi:MULTISPECIES: hypothetical protein [unclassified Bradyrhizobium]|uniref:hypothetical protein n=1 Tax=unclassified Bradyrhizobium TaxID=2631580 RepID=UPI00339180A0